jgi:hypothetical protein
MAEGIVVMAAEDKRFSTSIVGVDYILFLRWVEYIYSQVDFQLLLLTENNLQQTQFSEFMAEDFSNLAC